MFIEVKIKNCSNYGTIVLASVIDKAGNTSSVPFEHRAFANMWESLTQKQKRGKAWVIINALD